MPRILLTSLVFFSFFFACHPAAKVSSWQPGDPLFPIVSEGRWGFIDREGVEVIKPVFREVGAFVDSLAPARLNGTWGFINPKGEFVIPPVYDYATSFSEGYARVWEGAKPNFINYKGEKPWVLPDDINALDDFEDGKALFNVVKNGDVIDYILKETGDIEVDKDLHYSEGLAIISRKVPRLNTEYFDNEYAVQDIRGKLIVPFGRYNEINDFHNGFAEISVPGKNGDDDVEGFINRKGDLVFTLPKEKIIFENYFSEGVVACEETYQEKDSSRIIWYDTTGKRVMEMPGNKAGVFKNGRTFAGKARSMFLIDRNGHQLGDNLFNHLEDEDFSDNIAIVSPANDTIGGGFINHYGLIDSMGNYIVPPVFNHIHYAGFQTEGLLVAMDEPLQAKHKAPGYEPLKKTWGLIDRKGRWLFKPKLTQISPEGFKNGLLYAEIDSLYGYVNSRGKFVWSATRNKVPVEHDTLNISFMLRSSFYHIYSTDSTRYRSNRGARALQHAKEQGFSQDQIGIYVNTTEKTTFENSYEGLAMYIFNTTSDTLEINVQDNSLFLVAQALNSKGEWQNIEYNPSSWCGNSYYKIPFNANEYWKIPIPIYNGDFKTSIRLAFTYEKHWTEEGLETKTVFSNTFSGAVNPGQFWRQQGYSPGNFMDPYNN